MQIVLTLFLILSGLLASAEEPCTDAFRPAALEPEVLREFRQATLRLQKDRLDGLSAAIYARRRQALTEKLEEILEHYGPNIFEYSLPKITEDTGKAHSSQPEAQLTVVSPSELHSQVFQDLHSTFRSTIWGFAKQQLQIIKMDYGEDMELIEFANFFKNLSKHDQQNLLRESWKKQFGKPLELIQSGAPGGDVIAALVEPLPPETTTGQMRTDFYEILQRVAGKLDIDVPGATNNEYEMALYDVLAWLLPTLVEIQVQLEKEYPDIPPKKPMKGWLGSLVYDGIYPAVSIVTVVGVTGTLTYYLPVGPSNILGSMATPGFYFLLTSFAFNLGVEAYDKNTSSRNQKNSEQKNSLKINFIEKFRSKIPDGETIETLTPWNTGSENIID